VPNVPNLPGLDPGLGGLLGLGDQGGTDLGLGGSSSQGGATDDLMNFLFGS
jgi:hypothetical protein